MADADGGWQRVGVNGGGFSSPSNPRATLLLARSPSVRRRSDMRPPTDSGLCPCTRTRERVRSTDGTSELGIVATWPRLLGEACVNEGRADTCGGSALSAPFWRGESLQRYSDAVVFVVLRLSSFFLFVSSSSSSPSSRDEFFFEPCTLPQGGVVDLEFREL